MDGRRYIFPRMHKGLSIWRAPSGKAVLLGVSCTILLRNTFRHTCKRIQISCLLSAYTHTAFKYTLTKWRFLIKDFAWYYVGSINKYIHVFWFSVWKGGVDLHVVSSCEIYLMPNDHQRNAYDWLRRPHLSLSPSYVFLPCPILPRHHYQKQGSAQLWWQRDRWRKVVNGKSGDIGHWTKDGDETKWSPMSKDYVVE